MVLKKKKEISILPREKLFIKMQQNWLFVHISLEQGFYAIFENWVWGEKSVYTWLVLFSSVAL